MRSATHAHGERPRIGFYHPYPHRMGGSQQVALILARHLPATGYEPVMICPEDGRFTTAAREAGVEVVICAPGASWRVYGRGHDGIGGWISPRHASQLVGYWFKLRTTLREKRIALLHCHNVRAVIMAARAGQLASLPTLWHVHGAPPNGAAGWLASMLSLAAQHSVFVSQGMLDYWARRGWVHRSRHVIHNGIDAVALATPLERDRTRPLIVVVGSLSPVKGQDRLLAALPAVLREMPNAECWLVGQDWAGGTYERALRSLVEQLGLEGSVEFLGERGDVSQIIAASDCVVIPSRSESFGMVAVEAMAQRKVVVAAATGGLRDIVIDGETGFLVCADKQDEIAAAVVRVLQDRQLASRMGEVARRRALDSFSATGMSRRFADLYNNILGHQASKE
ncbi:MAG TPA: glycosyltransferase family 4 protein [Steroidobacteraceae bacterium]|nr:glycosyltransferase family 4 protein [Steroidobacteraceae bacterium]